MGGFNILPPGVKNLLIINILAFFATFVFLKTGRADLTELFGLHFPGATNFHVWQFVTYMFMHANFSHIFFNMFALWMFGAAVENTWGTKRFLIYYFITGLGAALVHYLITFFQIHPMLTLLNQFLDSPSLETYRYLAENAKDIRFHDMLSNNLMVLQQNPGSLDEIVSITANAKAQYLDSFNIIGASGAVYGVLLAFGMLFPNDYIYVYFMLPIKAKWFVIIYGVIELVTGLSTSDGIAHFAHLGGMIFGLIVILLWRRNERNHNGWIMPEKEKTFRLRRKKDKYYVSTESGRPLSDEEYNAKRLEEKKETDRILDKISKGGYESLSSEEKDFLFRQSQK
ncbi:MAG: rhomboid family intramembrane serine protease [Bacteroidales bacterium]|nr:rhomboid family intramembrane serine protease [Bacteroidales bacterium]